MNKRLMVLLGAGVGALSMYYLDPARGRYRRALLRGRLVHAGHEVRHGAGVVGRDARNRAWGTLAVLRSSFGDAAPEDRVLAERVRAYLGRVVTHPSSVQVEAADGHVALSGPILAHEVPSLLECVHRVRGVKAVHDHLEVHAAPGRVPGLQGNPRPRPGLRSELWQGNWSPAMRAATGLAGAAAALRNYGRAGFGRRLLTLTGALLLGRAVTNRSMRGLLGLGAGEGAVNVQKALRINAPVEQVFHLWDHVENFPAIMTHVREARLLSSPGEQAARWRWRVRSRGGIESIFDTVVTAREENRLLAWRTEAGAAIQHSGRVRFLSAPDGSTVVDLKMIYTPMGGAVGHALAWLVGADPKHQLDDDLMRMKTFLETGKPPRDAADRRSDVADILLRHEQRRLAAGAGARGLASRNEEQQ